MVGVSQAVCELFRAHGVDARMRGNSIGFAGSAMRASADIVREVPQRGGMTVQLQVSLEIAPGKVIYESVAGIGTRRDEAIADALKSFATNSFHVLVAAFFPTTDAANEQVELEEWNINGQARQVVLGPYGVRGTIPSNDDTLFDFFHRFRERLTEEKLSPGTHWIRLYYAHGQNQTLTCEVLRDNETWSGMEQEMAVYPWPSQAEFYSVRQFLVIQRGEATPEDARHQNAGLPGETTNEISQEVGGHSVRENMDPSTPEGAISLLAFAVEARPNATDKELMQALRLGGVPEPLAARTMAFTPTAWGRLLLDGMGIAFSPEFVIFDSQGSVAESGLLAGQPDFAAATRLGPQYMGTAAFERLALSSGEVDAINQLLHKGEKPEDVILAPAFVFLEPISNAGLKRAQKVMDQYTSALTPQVEGNTPMAESAATLATRKPWWRFW